MSSESCRNRPCRYATTAIEAQLWNFQRRKNVIYSSLLTGSSFSCYTKSLPVGYIYAMLGDLRADSRKDAGVSLSFCKLSPKHIARPKTSRLSDYLPWDSEDVLIFYFTSRGILCWLSYNKEGIKTFIRKAKSRSVMMRYISLETISLFRFNVYELQRACQMNDKKTRWKFSKSNSQEYYHMVWIKRRNKLPKIY